MADIRFGSILLAGAFVLSAPAAIRAMPASVAPVAAPLMAPIQDVAMGCGMGRSRDRMGRCHHRFNRFTDHERFHSFREKHCTMVETPNGSVRRCRI